MRRVSTATPPPPSIGRAQIALLERLCNACAVSGDESEVRSIVLEQVRPHVDELNVDPLGNVLAIRRGRQRERLKVMLAAHMDEVGFMLTHAEDKDQGIFRFETIGGIDERQLVGKSVSIGRDHVPGVIGRNPIHLTKESERRQKVSVDDLRIDVGSANSAKVRQGDRATFASQFARLGPSLRAKALDDRLGVVSLVELLKCAPPHLDLLAAFTVQEEVGLRGASVAAYTLDPQLAIVLDCTSANDLPLLDPARSPEAENTRYNTRLGAGPAIYVADRASLSDPRLVRHMVATAEALKIPYQIRQPDGSGTDAGAIHTQRLGVPTISVSVPARYLHTPAMLSRLADWRNTLLLIHSTLSRLTPAILAEDR